MPYVNIKVTREGVTYAQKEKLIRGVTSLLVEVLNKDPNSTMVVIDEIETDNWGFKNETVSTLRNRERAR
jgi:4-oxalocrotonate tautomerase